jgi:hypothetical protein
MATPPYPLNGPSRFLNTRECLNLTVNTVNWKNYPASTITGDPYVLSLDRDACGITAPDETVTAAQDFSIVGQGISDANVLEAGNVIIKGGYAGDGLPGDVSLTGGRGVALRGGLVVISGGQSGFSTGGDVTIQGGTSSTTDGGDIEVRGGNPNGDIALVPGPISGLLKFRTDHTSHGAHLHVSQFTPPTITSTTGVMTIDDTSSDLCGVVRDIGGGESCTITFRTPFAAPPGGRTGAPYFVLLTPLGNGATSPLYTTTATNTLTDFTIFNSNNLAFVEACAYMVIGGFA